MINKSIPAVYASAFFQISQAEGCLERIEGELYTLRELLNTNSKVKVFLKDSSITSEGKKKALFEILGENVSSLFKNQLSLVIDQGKERILLDLVEEFFLLASSAAGKVYADIVTAIPLSDDITASIQKKLVEIAKKEVVLKSSVDESIGGGIIIRIGDKVVDASIRKQLAELRRSITATH